MATMAIAATNRALFEKTFLVERVSIIRRTDDVGVLGTTQQSFAVVYSSVPCSIESRTRRDSRGTSKQLVNFGNEYLVKMAMSQDVQDEDILRLTADGVDTDYSIKSLYEHKVTAGVLQRLIVEKLSYLTVLGDE